MKSKLFSILMLIVAVLFVSAVQTVEASAQIDQDISIEQVVDFENADLFDLQNEFEEANHYTAMEVCPTAHTSTADIDHQLITVRAPINRYEVIQHGERQYLPRSNLNVLA